MIYVNFRKPKAPLCSQYVLCVIQLICDDTKYMYLDHFCKKMNSLADQGTLVFHNKYKYCVGLVLFYLLWS